ncbi:MAG: PQQ-binding-like beta-propeller repeat protein [Verrucomicrobiota bacterium]
MKIPSVLLTLSLTLLASTQAEDWKVWRGPHANGHASDSAKPPLEWAETKNITWKVPVPGRAHASPTVCSDHILLAFAAEDSQIQGVVSYSRETGEQQWRTDIHKGGFPDQIHKKNTHGSSTVATDGKRAFAIFFNSGSVSLTSLDLTSGAKLWQVNVGAFTPKYKFGFGSSPILHQGKIIVTAEFEKKGYIAAFSTDDGREIYRIPRTAGTSYSTPIVAPVGGREQLIISGQSAVSSYDPTTGKKLWQVPCSSPATCGTAVWSGDLIFTSGGYPNKETNAVRATAPHEVVWRNGEKCYEQSMLVVNGHLYGMNDNGIAFCWDAQTGEEQWKHRFRGPVSASPIFAGGHIYLTNEQGTTWVLEPNAKQMTLVATNQLGEEGFATPTFVENTVFIRTASFVKGQRQEFLYRIEE